MLEIAGMNNAPHDGLRSRQSHGLHVLCIDLTHRLWPCRDFHCRAEPVIGRDDLVSIT